MDRTACTAPQCLYSTPISLLPLWTVQPVQSLSACTVELYLYPPYEPYELYRASVPVQYSYTSTPPMDRTTCTEPQCLYSRAIPLLPLWAVRPVQSLSACTVQLYLYSPYGPTTCTEPQCLYSRAIPLLPLWAVRPVQSLSACTRVQYSFYLMISAILPEILHSLLFFFSAVKVLCYKSEGRWFDSRWCHWKFSLT